MRTLARLGLMALLPALGGCAAVVVAGLGGAAYLTYQHFQGGWVGATIAADFGPTIDAVSAVLDDLKLAHGDLPKTYPTSKFKALSSDENVDFVVTSNSSTSTEVKIRVGPLGDEDDDDPLSEKILAKIQERLKK